MATHTLRTALAAAALALTGAPTLHAQVDVIRGRVTAATDNAPIYGAVVTATSVSGNVSRTARTNTEGRYTITFPGGDGDYWINVAAIGFTPRRFELKRIADEAILIGDVRMSTLTLDTIQVTGDRRRPSRVQERDVSGTDRPVDRSQVAPDAAGDLAALAASQPGVTLIPGAEGDPSGFSVLGLSTDQNLTTLNGMNSGAGDLPRDAGVTASVATSPYDVSQGGFSGGALNVRTQSGSNFLDQMLSAIGNLPQLQWTDAPGRALGQEYTNLNIGGRFSGPLAYDKAFYNVAFQGGRRANDLSTLLNTSPVGLQTIGIAPDSLTRLLNLLQAEGVPTTLPGFPANRYGDQASFLGSVDFMPPTSSSGQAFNLTVNGSWNRSSPAGPLNTRLPTTAIEFSNWSGSARLRHSAYLGQVLTETGFAVSASRRELSPFLNQPGGSVLVRSDFADGSSGVQLIQFGGTSLRNGGTTRSVDASNHLSWFSRNNRHRVRLTSEVRYESWSQEQAGNLLGAFSFSDLDAFGTNAPSAFTRQLLPVTARGDQLVGAVSLGDSWRPNPDLQIVYGARVDGSRYLTRPERNPGVEQAFGLSNTAAPDGIYLSPRIGFSWTVGTAPQIAAFAGAARVPRAVVRGGVGIFQNTPAAQLIAPALTNTGLPGGTQQLICVGAAAPIPDWDAYAADASTIPTTCANGAPPSLGTTSPNVSLFAPDWAAPRSIRSTLQWSGPVLDNRFMATITGTWSLNQNQSGLRDLNFNPVTRFTLADEANRPVYVQPSSIAAASGAVSARDSRVAPQFNQVAQTVSDFRSLSRQLQVQVAPASLNSRFSWGVAYTLGSVRDRASGFASTDGNPLQSDEARSAFDWRHQIQFNLGVNLFDLLRVNWTQRYTSGTPFTPMVSSDINGDGFANDRAFVADPATAADPALGTGMTQLLAGAEPRVRECLASQLGRIAARNSCEGPWTSTGFLSIAFNPLRVKLPQRATLSLQVANPLGALDLALHGQNGLKGWGQTPTPDSRLLITRGFDTTAQRFRYEVNPRFGATTQAVSSVRNPVAVTLSMRFDLGPARERQQLTQTLDRGRTLPGTRTPLPLLRAMYGSGGIINPIAAILGQADSLRLTGAQADSLATLNRRYIVRMDSIWTPTIRGYAALPDVYSHGEVYRDYRRARESSVDLLMRLAPHVRELLTPSQRRQLPPLIAAYLDTRYLSAIRSGTSGSPGGPFAPGAGVPGGLPVMGGSGQTIIIR